MTVEEMIAERTVKVSAALGDANGAISLKGGTPSADLSGLSAAIATIPQSGGGLPLGITEMESGQFTVPSDTQGRITIQFTNFTAAPTHVAVWTTSITPATNAIKNILYDASGIPFAFDQIIMQYNAAGTKLQAIIGYAFNPSATGIQVGGNSGFVWQGGVVYYWMAWR